MSGVSLANHFPGHLDCGVHRNIAHSRVNRPDADRYFAADRSGIKTLPDNVAPANLISSAKMGYFVRVHHRRHANRQYYRYTEPDNEVNYTNQTAITECDHTTVSRDILSKPPTTLANVA
jgi:hypothetical protein